MKVGTIFEIEALIERDIVVSGDDNLGLKIGLF